MKKILCLIVASIFALSAMSQTSMSPAIDTLTNIDTCMIGIRLPGKFDILTFQVNYTKISGTPSTQLVLKGSLDGLNFVTLPGLDTATVLNLAGVQSFIWSPDKSRYLYYRIYGVSSGTQSGQLKAYVLSR